MTGVADLRTDSSKAASVTCIGTLIAYLLNKSTLDSRRGAERLGLVNFELDLEFCALAQHGRHRAILKFRKLNGAPDRLRIHAAAGDDEIKLDFGIHARVLLAAVTEHANLQPAHVLALLAQYLNHVRAGAAHQGGQYHLHRAHAHFGLAVADHGRAGTGGNIEGRSAFPNGDGLFRVNRHGCPQPSSVALPMIEIRSSSMAWSAGSDMHWQA